MSDSIGIIFYIGCVVCWFKAVIYDISHDNLAWAIFDIIIPPLGVLKGMVLFFS